MDDASAVAIMRRFADSVRVQQMVQSERILCYQILAAAVQVRRGRERNGFLYDVA